MEYYTTKLDHKTSIIQFELNIYLKMFFFSSNALKQRKKTVFSTDCTDVALEGSVMLCEYHIAVILREIDILARVVSLWCNFEELYHGPFTLNSTYCTYLCICVNHNYQDICE